MVWGKAGSTTLTTAGDDCDITSMTTSKFYQFLNHKLLSGSNAESTCTLNNDTSSVYARRGSDNGGTDFTSTGGSNWNLQRLDTGDEFIVTYLCSISGEEKLGLSFNCSGKPTPSLAPERKEQALKYVPSPDADITRIDMNNSNASGDYATGTNLSVLGSDLTPAPAVTFPSDVPDYTRAEITDTRKMYTRLPASITTLDHDFTESGSTSHTGNGTANSVEGWTTNDYTYSKINGTNDRLDFRSKGDGTNDSITYDLGSALSDSAWLIRFELTWTTLSHSGLAPGVDRNECNFGMFSSDYSSGFTTAQDSLGFQLHIDRDGTYRYYVHKTDGSGLTGYTSGQRNDNFTTTTYYVQMKRTSSTAFEVKFYTNNTYTTEISGDFSSSVTVPSTVTGLRYFGFKNSDNYNYGGDGAGYIDNVQIWNDISTVAVARWEEKGTT